MLTQGMSAKAGGQAAWQNGCFSSYLTCPSHRHGLILPYYHYPIFQPHENPWLISLLKRCSLPVIFSLAMLTGLHLGCLGGCAEICIIYAVSSTETFLCIQRFHLKCGHLHTVQLWEQSLTFCHVEKGAMLSRGYFCRLYSCPLTLVALGLITDMWRRWWQSGYRVHLHVHYCAVLMRTSESACFLSVA